MDNQQQRINVLLVDDEENILKSLKRLLMDEDFDIETATSGEAALEKLRTLDNVGLIVSDQRMPGMNGAEFLGRSQAFAPHAQRILLTGYSDISATIEAINKGGAGRYISKPWEDDELTLAIREAVALYLQGAEKRRLNEIIKRQNEELEAWNESLKKRLLQTTATIREQSQARKSQDDQAPLTILTRTFDNFFEIMGDHNAVHARTVSTLVTDVARRLGLDTETIARIRLAALLHDAGKFGSLAALRNKQVDEMSESEFSEYRQHPLRGEEMFRQVEELKEILPMIRSHHESYDGSGFPDGLQGDEIPLGARLIAIANLIEKSAHSVSQHRADYAMMSARFHRNTLLDPQLVSMFQSITKVVYAEGKGSGIVSEVEIGPANLMSGMLLARDVESATGVLLMQSGSVLDIAGIALIRSHYLKTPPQHGIFIQVTDD